MKKFLKVISIVFLALVLSVIILVKVYEKRLVEAFKNEIIDKTDLNIDFSNLHFSILKNFPYGSFILNDAHIFYSKPSRRDTLLSTKMLCFKINLINLFRNSYDFPEIIIYDGLINIDNDKIDQFLPDKNVKNEDSEYIVNTESIKFIRCRVKYTQKKDININLFIDKSTCSGSFLSKAISLKLDFNIYRFNGTIYGYKYLSNNLITLNAILNERDFTYFCENGKLSLGALDFNLSFLYNQKSELLQITTSTKRVSTKLIKNEFFRNLDINLRKGDIAIEVLYSINFKKAHSQKLSLKYNLENVAFENIDNLMVKNLEGSTTFSDNFNLNSTEIKSFLLDYKGLSFFGKSKVKNLPKPIILIDCGLKGDGEMIFSKDFSISGNLEGSLKFLVKINDIKKLELNNLNFSKFSSQLSLSDVSINGVDYLKGLTGKVNIENNSFLFNGEGYFNNQEFRGMCSFDNFFDIVLHNASIAPSINIEMDKLNLDEVIGKSESNIKSNSNIRLLARIGTANYMGADFKDLSVSLKSIKGNYLCENFSFKAFSGAFSGDFIYTGRDTNSLTVIGQGVNITELFKGFNNFSQSIIKSNNISGSVSGKVEMRYKSTSNGKIDPSTINASSSIIIENGKLTGISQLRKISKFLNLNEVDSIRFKTLQNIIEINKSIIKIPSMEISSNAINFRIAGEHNFNNEFTYWLKINLREILAKKFKSKKEYNPNIESDNKDGLNIFLKLYGNSDSYKVVYDRKSGVEHLKNNLYQEGQLLKTIIKEEFNLSKRKNTIGKDSILLKNQNNLDSSHNKIQKKPFKIEWDEIDTLKVKNQ